MIRAADFRETLSQITVLPRRLSLRTPGMRTHVPMLRGVWGAALRGMSMRAYEDVFVGIGPPDRRIPGYVLRPAAPDPNDAPAVEWITFGPSLAHDAELCRAWDVASGMGLGRHRRRFHLWANRTILPDGRLIGGTTGAEGAWPLSAASWPLPGDAETTPCRIRLDAPLRLLRRKTLLTRPNLADISWGILNRLSALQPAGPFSDPDFRGAVLEMAAGRPAEPWTGERMDLVRYSGRQREEIEMRGVVGSLDLPAGPGPLWPLITAACWVHIGRGTVFGLGQIRICPVL